MGEVGEEDAATGKGKSRRQQDSNNIGFIYKENVEEEEDDEEDDDKYVVDDVHERIKSSRGSRFRMLKAELKGLGRRKHSRESFVHGLAIHPDNRSVNIPCSLI